MTLVASNKNLGVGTIEQENHSRRIFRASNGQLIAILEGSSAVLTYSTSADGITWSAPAALLTPPAATTICSILFMADVLHVFYVYFTGALEPRRAAIAYITGSNTFSAPLVVPTGDLGADQGNIAAVWDSVQGVFYFATDTPAEATGLNLFAVSILGAIQAFGAMHNNTAGVDGRIRGLEVIPGLVSEITLLYQNGTPGPLWLWRATQTVGSSIIAIGGMETVVASPTVLTAATALDNTGKVDILYVDTSYNLQAVKRLGTNIFSIPVNVARGVNPSYPSISLTPDGTGGLYCFYSSRANQSNGEIYFVQRTGGSWATPGFFAGGDASGYEIPRSAPTMSGSQVDVLYQKGTIAPFSVYYAGLPLGSAPNVPAWLGPSGYETSLTPLASFRYSNPNALDLQGKVEYRYKESGTIIAESGAITTDATSNVYGVGWNAGDPDYVAPATLVFGHTYTGEVRVQDATLGLWSGWSTPVSFTPVHGGTVTITTLTDDAVVSGSTPATIDSPNFDSITASWLQGDGHASDAYRDTLWNSGQTAIIQQTVVTTIGGDLASGASFTSGSWNATNLQNATTYLLIRSYRDKITQLWSDSPPWTIDTAWTPPAPVTGLTATPNDDEGTVTLAWTAGGGTSIDVAMSPHGLNEWQTLPNIGATVHETVYPCPFQSMDYRARTVDALGIFSADAIVTATMGARATNRYAIWITSLALPTTLSVALGGKDSSNATTGLKWDNEEDAVETVYHGNRYPTTDWGLTDFKTVDVDFDIPPIYALKSGGYGTALADVAGLEEMWRRREPLLYRDMDGVQRICEMHKWETERDRVGRYTVRFTLRESQAFVTPLVSP